MKYILYTDGGARGNPGKAGIGIVICDESGKILHKASKALGEATNNEAEYHGVIFGLNELQKIASNVQSVTIELRMDSQLVARQIKREYKIKEPRMKELWEVVQGLIIAAGLNLIVTEIPREENKEADRLANEAMDSVR